MFDKTVELGWKKVNERFKDSIVTDDSIGELKTPSGEIASPRDLKDMMNEPTFSKRNSEKAIDKSKSMIAPTNKSSSGETEKMTKHQSLIEQDKVSLKKVDKLETSAKVDLININFSEGGEFAKEIKNQTLNMEN